MAHRLRPGPALPRAGGPGGRRARRPGQCPPAGIAKSQRPACRASARRPTRHRTALQPGGLCRGWQTPHPPHHWPTVPRRAGRPRPGLTARWRGPPPSRAPSFGVIPAGCPPHRKGQTARVRPAARAPACRICARWSADGCAGRGTRRCRSGATPVAASGTLTQRQRAQSRPASSRQSQPGRLRAPCRAKN